MVFIEGNLTLEEGLEAVGEYFVLYQSLDRFQ